MAKIESQRTTSQFSTHRPDDVTPTVAVVKAVSTVTEQPVEDLPPLASAVDPDALNTLCTDASSESSATVSFTYAGHHVTVSTSGEITVCPEES